MAEMVICSSPGCDQPAGIKKCSACKTTPYCSVICQTADWPHHKEECPGHLDKMAMTYIEKAKRFEKERNCEQILRYANLALTKLKQLKDRSLAIINILDSALRLQFNALNFMGRKQEALECATEWYTMWETTNRRNPKTIAAAFVLIQSLTHNKEFDKAHLIAATVYEQTTHPMTNDIPEYLQQPLLAKAAGCLAEAIDHLATNGGIPPEETQKAGEQAIALARKAMQIHTQLHGAESDEVIADMRILAGVLSYFSDVDDDEVTRLFKQVIAVNGRLYGSSSVNVASPVGNLGKSYILRALRTNDLDRSLTLWEMALSHLREAARIYRINNHVDLACDAERDITTTERAIRLTRIQVTVRAAGMPDITSTSLVALRDRARAAAGASTRSVDPTEQEAKWEGGEMDEEGRKGEEENVEEREGEEEEGKGKGVVSSKCSTSTSTSTLVVVAVAVAVVAAILAAIIASMTRD